MISGTNPAISMSPWLRVNSSLMASISLGSMMNFRDIMLKNTPSMKMSVSVFIILDPALGWEG